MTSQTLRSDGSCALSFEFWEGLTVNTNTLQAC